MASKRAWIIQLKRAYEPPSAADGARVLVDRVWPRGVSKDSLPLDAWAKELAPSTALRKWFGHDRSKWAEFKTRYLRELEAQPDATAQLLALCRRGKLTLVFAAKDPQHNNAVVLKEHLERHRG